MFCLFFFFPYMKYHSIKMMSSLEMKGLTGRSEDERHAGPFHRVMPSSPHSSLGEPLVSFTRAKYDFAFCLNLFRALILRCTTTRNSAEGTPVSVDSLQARWLSTGGGSAFGKTGENSGWGWQWKCFPKVSRERTNQSRFTVSVTASGFRAFRFSASRKHHGAAPWPQSPPLLCPSGC